MNMHANVSSRAFTLLVGLILLIGIPAPASAASDPSGVSFTLEGCRNNGTITLPNGSGAFVCPDAAYTTGNLGKGWNELDLVPHRITAQAGNSAPATQTYAISIAADNCNGSTGTSYTCADGSTRTPGYDVMSLPVLNTSLSNASCPISVGAQTALAPGVGGTAVSIARVLTIGPQARNTTCVYDYYERLALGSHLFPGASLHSDLLNQTFGTQGIGAKDVSIPVKEISPQSLAKDMTASEGADNQWSVTKEGTPAALSFGDVCVANAPQPQGVSIKVTWTVNQTLGGINVVTHVYATNPASRVITANVIDTVYAGLTQTTQLSTTGPNPVSVDVPANSTVLVLTDTQTFDPTTTGLNVGDALNDVATATYTDKATGISVPGQTTATASTTIAQGNQSNAMIDVTDTESITGTGLSFAVNSPTTGYTNGYVAGTQTTGPVTFAAPAQTGNGSVTFSKTVYLDTKRVTTGTLSDTAKILVGQTELSSATLSTSISSTATVALKVTKSVPDILNTGEKFEVKFHVAGSVLADPQDPTSVYSNDVTLTFNPGDTSKSVTLSSLQPDTYVVTESDALWYASGSNVGVSGLINPVGSNQQSASLGPSNCSTELSFTNAVPAGAFAKAQVQKITYPSLTSSDADYNWSFTLKDPSNVTLKTVTAGAGAGYVGFGIDLTAEGTYKVIETTRTGWDLNSASPNNGTDLTTCAFTVNYPQSENTTYSCTFTNTKRGHAQVLKTVQRAAVSGSQSYTFQLRKDATTSSDGTTLETLAATAANGGTLNFATSLVPGTTYQMCEIVAPGWNTNLAPLASLFVPNSIIPPSLPNPDVNNMTVCVNFTVDPGATKTFSVDNSPPPGGRALTIGFWKNWASCTTSSTSKKPTLDATLYGILQNGIVVGKVASVVPAHAGQYSFFGQTATSTADCAHAVSLLNKTDFGGKKQSSDPLFNMTAQLIAAELNGAAGAYSCGPVVNAIAAANTLLSNYKFTGFGYTGKLSASDATAANNLATRLDNYNNDRPSACQ